MKNASLSLMLFLLSLISIKPAVATHEHGAFFYGEGTLVGNFAFFSLEAERVRSILPPGMDLGPQTLSAAGTHPVVFILGRQQDIRIAVAGHSVPSILDSYHEVAILIPYVRLDEQNLDFSYMPQLFLDSRLAILAGVPYAFNKAKASIKIKRGMDEFPDRYTVTTSDDGTLIEANFIHRGQYNESVLKANFAPLQAAIGLPLASPGKRGFVCGVQPYNFKTLKIEPFQSHLIQSTNLLGGLFPTEMPAPALDEAPLGSFHMTGSWRLSRPLKCSDEESLAKAAKDLAFE